MDVWAWICTFCDATDLLVVTPNCDDSRVSSSLCAHHISRNRNCLFLCRTSVLVLRVSSPLESLALACLKRRTRSSMVVLTSLISLAHRDPLSPPVFHTPPCTPLSTSTTCRLTDSSISLADTTSAALAPSRCEVPIWKGSRDLRY